jgi:nucleoside-diphosphate-sugar epimerase
MPAPLDILVTGGTGYIGQHLIPALLARGHRVRAGATQVVGDALAVDSVSAAIRPGDSVVHLVGTPHPTPSKADQFEKVDLVSIRATVSAAKQVGISHLVYLSVAQPAPIMQAYLWVRALGEAMIREARLTATIVRPWYVLGPGRRWPKLIAPLYKIAEMIPATRATAERLGLVTVEQMIKAIISALENPPPSGQQRIVNVAGIRRARL